MPRRNVKLKIETFNVATRNFASVFIYTRTRGLVVQENRQFSFFLRAILSVPCLFLGREGRTRAVLVERRTSCRHKARVPLCRNARHLRAENKPSFSILVGHISFTILFALVPPLLRAYVKHTSHMCSCEQNVLLRTLRLYLDRDIFPVHF